MQNAGLAILAAGLILSSGNAFAAVGDITQYPVPTPGSVPDGIAAGPDGNIWFTELGANKVAKVTTSGGFTEYPVPTPNSGPSRITAGPDGNLWFTEVQAGKVGKVTTSGVFTEYPVPTVVFPSASPSGIVAGPDGNLWFTELQFAANKVAKVTTAGVFTEYPVPTANSAPDGIAAGPDGNLWFTEGSANKVAKVTTAGAFTEYSIPTANSVPAGIAAGPDGNLWFTEEAPAANKVAKVTTAGVFTEYPVPTAFSEPNGIAAGPEGNLWFTEFGANKVAQVTTSGAVIEYSIPLSFATGDAHPGGIVAGPDGSLWFTETSANKVDKVTTLSVAHSVAGGIGTDGAMWISRIGSTGLTSLGGVFLGAPAIVSVPQGGGASTPIYIGTGQDHDLWVRNDTTTWRPLTNHPVYCIDNPAGVVLNSTLYVACQGGDHALWHAEATAPTGQNLPLLSSSSWSKYGGILIAGPAVGDVGGVPTYFVLGTDHLIYTGPLGGAFTVRGWGCIGHPAAARVGGTTYFACHGWDDAVWYDVFSGSSWGAAASLGGLALDGVGIAANAGVVTFWAEGADGQAWSRSLGGSWTTIGGILRYGIGGLPA